ncbi:ATP-binding protein [Ectobacillus funiculus]|uniref:ATP-binding protein n=1 Tax=Ectobacillus funiculus TaxID=137993 RepID=UPI00397C9A04
MKLTIGKKILIGYLSIALLLGGTSGISYYYIKQINNSYSDLIDRRVTILANTKQIQTLALKQTNSLRGYLLTQDTNFLVELQTANESLQELTSSTKGLLTEQTNKEAMQELTVLNKEFERMYEELLKRYESNHNQEEALQYFKEEVFPIGKQLDPLANTITERQQELLSEGKKANTELVEQVILTNTLLNVLIFILTIGIGLFISRNITGNLGRITKVISSFASYSASNVNLPRIHVRSKDETSEIAEAFNELTHALEENRKQEMAFKQALQEQNWLETSAAEIATMYQGVHDLRTLTGMFLTKIAPMMDASYGAFYIKQGTGSQQRFYKFAAYAYDSNEIGRESFAFGEGLVGQAALENRSITLTNPPDSYIQIQSAIGAAAPSYIMIIPVEFEGQVTAVIELASFQPLTPIQQALLKQVVNHAGITIHSVMGRMKVEELLKESQALTAELQSQSEELQMQQEELRSINEELGEQYRESEEKTRILTNTQLELEEKAHQLALSSTYKSEFLANMSHELRTPLNSLLILAHLLAENTDGNLTEAQLEFIQTIYSSGNELLHLINDVLDLAKVESGKLDMTRDEVSLQRISAFTERQFAPLAAEKGLSFTVRLEADLTDTIYTDEHRLRQVLKNLLSNAFKFTEKGGVALHIHRVQTAILPDQQTALAFSVSDTGIGIKKEEQELIFQAFKQADGTTNRKYGGTGLGLSISRDIAHLLGGTIELQSEKGIGSTFTLYLPISEAAGTKNAELEAASAVEVETSYPGTEDPLLQEKKVLIIDDDMRNIFALTTALEQQKMQVLFAENGKDGIELLQKHPDTDIVLMDIMLPEMNGYEAMQAIRTMPKFQNIPIIALTAKAMKQDRERCIAAGASDYISKPIQLEQLFSVMKVWFY